jgi:hypothetical protein
MHEEHAHEMARSLHVQESYAKGNLDTGTQVARIAATDDSLSYYEE